jgi:gamma-glutamyltranspeptidase / glutathione hydrolase
MSKSTRSQIDWDKLHPSELPAAFQPFASRRSQVLSTRGICSSAQPLASAAGVAILNQGGNAADAAVAVAAALNVTEPCSTGIGGDAFCLYYEAKTKKVRAFNGSGRSPQGMTLEKLRQAGVKGSSIPLMSIHAATVPGAPALWVDAVEQLGSGKVKLSDVLAPAIRLAEDGYPVSEIVAQSWSSAEKAISTASDHGHHMLLDGKAPMAGEVITMPYLAQTFRELASKGKDGFYKGRIAEAIVELIQSKGGFMELSDLAKHAELGSEEVTPISYTYNHGDTDQGKHAGEGVTLHECPPNGQGLTALIALGILDELQDSGVVPDLNTMDHNSAEYLHVLIEALRIAFADTFYYVADPAVQHVPVKELLSKDYLKERAKLFDSKKSSNIEKGAPVSSSDTVYLSVVDEEGNACSFINSNCKSRQRQAVQSFRYSHLSCSLYRRRFWNRSHPQRLWVHPPKQRLRLRPLRRSPELRSSR